MVSVPAGCLPVDLLSGERIMTLRICCGLVVCVASTGAIGAPDGVVSPGEGWTQMFEGVHGAPFSGGSLSNADFVGESSAFNWWDSGAGVNRMFDDNRADIIDVWVRTDADTLHLAVSGPNVVFNNWFAGGGPGQDNDQGDIFIAIDASGSGAAGALAAGGGHSSFGGVKAVDFDGWSPTHVIGVQYADNGGGGGGFANLFDTGTNTEIDGDLQFAADGGFEWAWTVAGNGDGVFEFEVPWSMLGYEAAPLGAPLRFSVYTTQNFPASDTYDSGPAFANGSLTEQLGDNPGDPDSGGQLGASDPGSTGQPGSNFVGGSLGGPPSHNDQVDTIEEYYAWPVGGGVSCPGDANGDLVVDFDDLNIVLGAWNTSGPMGDVNDSGFVDFDDLNLVLSNWGIACN